VRGGQFLAYNIGVAVVAAEPLYDPGLEPTESFRPPGPAVDDPAALGQIAPYRQVAAAELARNAPNPQTQPLQTNHSRDLVRSTHLASPRPPRSWSSLPQLVHPTLLPLPKGGSSSSCRKGPVLRVVRQSEKVLPTPRNVVSIRSPTTGATEGPRLLRHGVLLVSVCSLFADTVPIRFSTQSFDQEIDQSTHFCRQKSTARIDGIYCVLPSIKSREHVNQLVALQRFVNSLSLLNILES
jgi:hypothetical protein